MKKGENSGYWSYNDNNNNRNRAVDRDREWGGRKENRGDHRFNSSGQKSRSDSKNWRRNDNSLADVKSPIDRHSTVSDTPATAATSSVMTSFLVISHDEINGWLSDCKIEIKTLGIDSVIELMWATDISQYEQIGLNWVTEVQPPDVREPLLLETEGKALRESLTKARSFTIKGKCNDIARAYHLDDLSPETQTALLKLNDLFPNPVANNDGHVHLIASKGRVDVWRFDDITKDKLCESFALLRLNKLEDPWRFDKNGFDIVVCVPYAEKDGQLYVMQGWEPGDKAKSGFHFPFSGRVARGADRTIFDTIVREWDEERLGDPSLEWHKIFAFAKDKLCEDNEFVFTKSLKFDAKHKNQQLFVFVAAKRDSISPWRSIVMQKEQATDDNPVRYHQGHSEWAEMEKVGWVRVNLAGRPNCMVDKSDYPDGKFFSAFENDQRLLFQEKVFLESLLQRIKKQ